jgi:hypothetical protein
MTRLVPNLCRVGPHLCRHEPSRAWARPAQHDPVADITLKASTGKMSLLMARLSMPAEVKTTWTVRCSLLLNFVNP